MGLRLAIVDLELGLRVICEVTISLRVEVQKLGKRKAVIATEAQRTQRGAFPLRGLCASVPLCLCGKSFCYSVATANMIHSFHGAIMAEPKVVFVTYGRIDTLFIFDESL